LEITRKLLAAMSSAFVQSSLHRAWMASRLAVRNYSTGPSLTTANVEKAQKFAKKAYEQAQSGASKLSEAAKPYLGSPGERVSGLAGSYRQPLLYNFTVAREFLKQIYTAERLAPPTSLSQITSVYKQLYSSAISIPFWRELWMSGQWTKVAIYGLEAYGIFHIGEMIGRRHIIGYKLE